ncbi:MAG: sulfatase-like hydrolase/transferase [Planctomycetaceae bacterium]|nr:sulfatase-like hydrolase/transferase [Planctomycetaceae bacterium]
MRTCIVSTLLFCLAISRSFGGDHPNMLFLLSDDHSYPYLSCYDDPNVKTPVLQQLAADGMKFHRFFTAAPQCVPSRAAYLTGRSPVAARITRFSSALARDEITFPELLKKDAGYYVGVCGRSYHLDGSGQRGGSAVAELMAQHQMRTFQDRFDYVKTGSDTEAVQQASEFLESCPEGKPFCLWVNFSDPHHAWNAPAEFRPDPATLKLPAHWPDLPGMREQFADYCAEVNRVDQTVGKVLDLLKDRGLQDNTIVVFAGDNGAALPHGKGSLYDPGSNVPFIVRWPGVVAPGRESRNLLSGEDLAPTLLEAAGVAVPDRMSGRSFLPLLKQQESWNPRKYVFVERGPHGSAPVTVNIASSGYDLSRAVRSDRYKFIYNCTPWIPYSPVDSAGGAAWTEMKQALADGTLSDSLKSTYFTSPRPVYELYDLETDPSELTNLSGKPELAGVERELRIALVEKMILDFDYLPLPAIADDPAAGNPSAEGKGNRKSQNNDRARSFQRLDTNMDGQLSLEEFRVGRQQEEADRWFALRDVNKDGSVNREEYLPANPLPATSETKAPQ